MYASTYLATDERWLSRQERSRRTADLLAESAECSPQRRAAILDEVILINRGVAESVASRFRNRGVPADDLRQVAYLGLTRAVRRYDAGRADDLLTYAVPTIRGELQRYFRDHGWSVRPTRRVQELQWRMSRASEQLAQQTGSEPTDEELRLHLGVDQDEYAEAALAFGCFQPTSLDQPSTKDSATSLGDLIGELQTVDPVDARVMLRPVLRRLDERERRILYLRFFEDLTQEELGQRRGVTQMQVSRVLKAILRKLHDDLEGSMEARTAARCRARGEHAAPHRGTGADA